MKFTGKIFSILLANVILFLLVFICTEGIFRVVGIPYKVKYIPNENSFARFDPELGWSYIPNISTIHKTGDTEKEVHFDRHGLRVPNAQFRPDSSEPSILFVGGSFTMGHGLSYEESFAGKLAALVKGKYQVINAGVQGYGSDQALLALKRYLPQFNTKIVVYTFIEDHIFRNGNYDRRMLVPTARFLGTKPQFALDKNHEVYMESPPLLYKDYVHSYLFDFIRMRLGRLTGRFPPFPADLTKALIQEMRRYSAEHGAHFVVLNWRWTLNDYDGLFHELDVDTIDTMDHAPDGWEKKVLFNGVHPDAEAGDHAAELLRSYLQKKGFLNN